MSQRRVHGILALAGLACSVPNASLAQATRPSAPHSVVWTVPGSSYKDSMPIGNGDIGLNLWTEHNGDVVFLIGKTDAWTENGQLVKLGRVRVSFSPSPFVPGTAFRQVLHPRTGEIEIRGDNNAVLYAWVDANAPAVHLELACDVPVAATARLESWRDVRRITRQGGVEIAGIGSLREWSGLPGKELTIEPDTVLPAKDNSLVLAHRNARSLYPLVFENQHLQSLLPKYPDPLLNRTFGVAMQGDGFVSEGDRSLRSGGPTKNLRLDLFALTEQAASLEAWNADLSRMIAHVRETPIELARRAHRQWWEQFWNRSWIDVSGDADADNVTQGYAMQRWMTAGNGRGAAAMKYNGGIFTVGQEPPASAPYDPAKGEENADFRHWGSNYWFQNTRLVYWPMIASGDWDTLAPFYKMYTDALPLARDRTRLIYGHAGTAFPETMFFWGLPNNNDYGWGNPGPDMTNHWIRWHVNNGLELTQMLLDTYDTTGDTGFARQTLLPLATELTTYFDQHWKRSASGKLHFEPSAALETRQWAADPAPDLAGLRHVLPRLIALPHRLTTASQRGRWQKMLADLPPLPRGHADATGKSPNVPEDASQTAPEILWPAEKFATPNNVENPELYAVFPYRLFGVGLPELELARATYDARRFVSSTCWGQDGIQAACLGWTDRAKAEVILNFTAYTSQGEHFKWFWKQGHDWEPDLDNGGAGQLILQNMLLQTRGDKLLLLPAWPEEWNVDFKLHAPQRTVIECTYRDGKIERLAVSPKSRAKDIVIIGPQQNVPKKEAQ